MSSTSSASSSAGSSNSLKRKKTRSSLTPRDLTPAKRTSLGPMEDVPDITNIPDSPESISTEDEMPRSYAKRQNSPVASASAAAAAAARGRGIVTMGSLNEALLDECDPVGASADDSLGSSSSGRTISGSSSSSREKSLTEDDSVVLIGEKIYWMPVPDDGDASLAPSDYWIKFGRRRSTVSADSNRFCDSAIVSAVLGSRLVFDGLDREDLISARERSDSFLSAKNGIFMRRSAMKMANLDAVFDFMFTNPKTKDREPMVGKDQLLYFADVCAGPGGFSEYVLWRRHWKTRGFGFTLRDPKKDFNLDEIQAGPVACFEPHYGSDGDGQITKRQNILAFEKHVLANTCNEGVHIMMADGGSSTDGEESKQELHYKRLILCQFATALAVVRVGGNFVCKMFDIFTDFTAGLVYLMRSCFEKVSIHRPNTSRSANSERYLVCKWKKAETLAVFQHLLDVNSDLQRQSFYSDRDVVEVVPPEILLEDVEFTNYLRESNSRLGRRQMQDLSKIVEFCKSPNTWEAEEQTEIRELSLEFWRLPDEIRHSPRYRAPKIAAESLLDDGGGDFLEHEGTLFDPAEPITLVNDWKFVLNSGGRAGCFLLGMGGAKIYRYSVGGDWYPAWDIHLELPSHTILFAEVVTEVEGNKTAVHILDAVFIGGDDLRKLDFDSRHRQATLLCEAVNKLDTRDDLFPLRTREIFVMDDLADIVDRVRNRDPLDWFIPSGVTLFRMVKEPYSISRVSNCKYWLNQDNNVITFQCPADAALEFESTYRQRLIWSREEEEDDETITEDEGEIDRLSLSAEDVNGN